MISISKKDLKQYPVIGSGKYGIVYKINDSIAYKIYRPTLPDMDGLEMVNPVLLTSSKTIHTLLKRDKQLEYTDLIQDYITIDGRFGGVCIPYYDGKTLAQLQNTSYQVKRNISKQLVRNHSELLKNFIYPRDYHTGNIMVTGDYEAKIIDLDDHLTRVSRFFNPFLVLLTTGRLNETIREFFHEPLSSRGKELEEMLERPRATYSSSIHWLDSYLERLEKCQDYLLIDSYSNLEIINRFMNNHTYRILLITNSSWFDYPDTLHYLYFLKENGLSIYDVVSKDRIDNYFNNNPAKRKILIHEDTPQVLTR